MYSTHQRSGGFVADRERRLHGFLPHKLRHLNVETNHWPTTHWSQSNKNTTVTCIALHWRPFVEF